MKFPLADWIDAHRDCRHDLGTSGMRGAIRHPTASPAEVRSADPEVLRRECAESLDVDPGRLFLTHGASEANAAILWFLARRYRDRRLSCRVAIPEYPPLFGVARWAGFEVSGDRAAATIAVVSQPRNPEGDLWTRDRLESWAEGTRSLLVDETFREFAHRPSVARDRRPGVWATGTLTKFFAGDDLRVGFVVAPEEERSRYAPFHGMVFDELPPASVAGALVTLRAREPIRRKVDRLMERNRAAFGKAFPRFPPPQAPVHFDRDVVPDGDSFAKRCLRASVLVCPGSFFGDRSGVRIGLTRPSFPEDLAAYLRVRDASHRSRARSVKARSASRAVRPRREGSAPAKAGRA